jgi:hypothetical protein
MTSPLSSCYWAAAGNAPLSTIDGHQIKRLAPPTDTSSVTEVADTWGFSSQDPPRPAVALFERNALRFDATSNDEKRLDHAIDDDSGSTIGWATEEPKVRLWALVPGVHRLETRVGIYDTSGMKLLDLGRRKWPPRRPLEITDAVGGRVGSIARTGRRRFQLRDAVGRPVGSVVRSARMYGVDFRIADAQGLPVARIVDPERLGFEGEPPGSRAALSSWLKRLALTNEPRSHLLLIEAYADLALRKLMVAAGAAVYLFLQRPQTSGD